MKVVLSRKGFDSEFGGGPSPVLPDGRLLSLPIPSPGEAVRYQDLRLEDRTYASMTADLGYAGADGTCHLDPDLTPTALDRHPDWLPLFGQIGAAEGHLRNQAVGPGDLFLFFGWFRRTIQTAEGLRFDPEDRSGRHLIYGYLEVGGKIEVGPATPLPQWMDYHPHACPTRRARTNNTIYIATRNLSWCTSLPGAGTFRYDRSLVLTADGQARSRWALPEFFRGARISYHTEKAWRPGYFQSAAKGQEFVCESDEVAQWARDLVARFTAPPTAPMPPAAHPAG